MLTTVRAADVLGVSRQMRRLRHCLEVFGEAGLMDGRGATSGSGTPQSTRSAAPSPRNRRLLYVLRAIVELRDLHLVAVLQRRAAPLPAEVRLFTATRAGAACAR